jgi:hypothetical protein
LEQQLEAAALQLRSVHGQLDATIAQLHAKRIQQADKSAHHIVVLDQQYQAQIQQLLSGLADERRARAAAAARPVRRRR